MVWNHQNANYSLREQKFYCDIYYNFRHTFVPYVQMTLSKKTEVRNMATEEDRAI